MYVLFCEAKFGLNQLLKLFIFSGCQTVKNLNEDQYNTYFVSVHIDR